MARRLFSGSGGGGGRLSGRPAAGGGGSGRYEPTSEESQVRGIVRDIARLYTSTDKDARKKAEDYIKEYGGSIPREAWATVGLEEVADEYAGKNDSWADKAKGFAGKGLSDIFGVIDAPSQAVLHGIDAATGPQDRRNPISAALHQLTNPTDHSDDINLRGALDKSPTEGGRLLGAVDTIGTIALDPLTYATLGTSAVAKGATQAGARGLVREGAETGALRLAELRQGLNPASDAARVGVGAAEMGVKRAERETAQTLQRHNLSRALKELGVGGEQASRRERRRIFQDTLERSYVESGMSAEKAARAAKGSVGVMQWPRLGPAVLDSVPGARRAADAAGRAAAGAGQTALGTWARRAFVPGSRTSQVLSPEVYATMKEIGGKTQAGMANFIEETDRHLVRLAKEARMSDDELRLTLDALDEPGRAARAAAPVEGEELSRVDQLAEDFIAAGHEEKALLVRELDTMRRTTDQMILEAGADPKKLHDVESYVRRYLTDAGRKAVKKSERAGGPLLGFGSDPGRLTARDSALRDLPVTEVNDALLERSGGERLFEENPLAIAMHSTVDAKKISLHDQMLDEMESKLVMEDGTPLLVRQVKDENGVRAGFAANTDLTKGTEDYVKIDFGSPLGEVRVHPEIVDDLKVFQQVIGGDEATGQFGVFMDKWMKLWRGYATVPVVGGTGFMSRNFQGNLFNNYIAGIRNPKAYFDAGRVQLALMKAERSGTVINAENLAKLLKGDKDLAEAVIKARERGVISSSFFRTDLGENLRDVTSASHFKGLGKHTANPLDNRNFVLSTGQSMNAAVEDNARLTHFLEMYKRHGDADLAEQSTKKFLFDYNDLTAFERDKMRRVIPFYTFMRKNAPLMFKELGADPGKLARVERARRSLFQGDQDPKTEDGLDRFLPEYIREGQVGPAAGWLSSLVGGGESGAVFASPELPYNAALETAAPAVELAAQVPGLDAVLPDSWKNDEGFQGVAAAIINLPGGGPNELARFLIEEGTGVDMFTGADVEADTRLQRLSDVFAPVLTKTWKSMEGGGPIAVATGDADAETKARLLRNILGLNAMVVTDERSAGARYGVYQDIKDDIEALEESGTPLPTAEELVDWGVLPDTEAYRDPDNAESGYAGNAEREPIAGLRAVPGLRAGAGSSAAGSRRRLFSD